MEYSSDVEHARAIKRGDESAIKWLIKYYQDFISSKIIRSLGFYKSIWIKHEDDIIQDAFLNVWKNISSYDESGRCKFSTWATSILINAFRSRARRKYVKNELNFCDVFQHSGSTGIEDIIEDRETPEPWQELSENEEYQVNLKKLSESISRLPRKQRQVVITHTLERRTVKDTARILKIPVGSVKSAGNTAIKKLRYLAGVNLVPREAFCDN